METLWPVLAIVGALSLGVISPGPSFVFIAQRSVAVSRLDGLGASLGMGVGGIIFAILALLGLHSLFTLFPWLFLVLKVVGGSYLMFLGWKIWKGSKKPISFPEGQSANQPDLGRSFVLGLATQLSNPKTAIVYGSVFASLLPPHFSWIFALWLLPLVFCIEAGWYSFVAVALSTPGPRRVYLGLKTLFDRSAGVILGLLGIKLLLTPEA